MVPARTNDFMSMDDGPSGASLHWSRLRVNRSVLATGSALSPGGIATICFFARRTNGHECAGDAKLVLLRDAESSGDMFELWNTRVV